MEEQIGHTESNTERKNKQSENTANPDLTYIHTEARARALTHALTHTRTQAYVIN